MPKILFVGGRGQGKNAIAKAILKIMEEDNEETLRACREDGRPCNYGICSECKNLEGYGTIDDTRE